MKLSGGAIAASEEIKFAPAKVRWVRLTGAKRATQYGYSPWELKVFRD